MKRIAVHNTSKFIHISCIGEQRESSGSYIARSARIDRFNLREYHETSLIQHVRAQLGSWIGLETANNVIERLIEGCAEQEECFLSDIYLERNNSSERTVHTSYEEDGIAC